MKFSAEFRSELMKAIRLSLFLTAILFGILLFQAGQMKETSPSRSFASDAEKQGLREDSVRRATPPFVRSAQ